MLGPFKCCDQSQVSLPPIQRLSCRGRPPETVSKATVLGRTLHTQAGQNRLGSSQDNRLEGEHFASLRQRHEPFMRRRCPHALSSGPAKKPTARTSSGLHRPVRQASPVGGGSQRKDNESRQNIPGIKWTESEVHPVRSLDLETPHLACSKFVI